MFTGIIEELGEVLAWEPTARRRPPHRARRRSPSSDATHGDSISVSGVCLTVVDQGADWFTADVMGDSIAMSTLGDRRSGDRVNLERAAAVGDRLGGHIVQGHIDGTATRAVASTTAAPGASCASASPASSPRSSPARARSPSTASRSP